MNDFPTETWFTAIGEFHVLKAGADYDRQAVLEHNWDMRDEDAIWKSDIRQTTSNDWVSGVNYIPTLVAESIADDGTRETVEIKIHPSQLFAIRSVK